jgi:hypothetical protein
VCVYLRMHAAHTHTHRVGSYTHAHTQTQEYCDMYLKSVGSMSETGEAPKSVQ